MKSFLTLLASGCLLAPSFAALPPNIVVFLVDDMGVMDTSVPFLTDAAGKPVRYPLNDFYRTPNMERLAARGVRRKGGGVGQATWRRPRRGASAESRPGRDPADRLPRQHRRAHGRMDHTRRLSASESRDVRHLDHEGHAPAPAGSCSFQAARRGGEPRHSNAARIPIPLFSAY